ncbi:MAG: hypothetical protein ACRC1T_11735 [Clostridium chrysemydis]
MFITMYVVIITCSSSIINRIVCSINSGDYDIKLLSYLVSIIILTIIFSLKEYYEMYRKNDIE